MSGYCADNTSYLIDWGNKETMDWAIATIAIIGWCVALFALALLPGRGRRRDVHRALSLQRDVEPYLRMRAAELSFADPLPTEPSEDLDETITRICKRARVLSGREPDDIALGDTVSIESLDTTPVSPKAVREQASADAVNTAANKG